MLHVLPERRVTSGNGIELGWHSSISMARSGVHFAKHCNLMSACRWRLRMLCEEYDCASSESDGLGEDVTLIADMLKSYRDGSTSLYEYSDELEAGVSGPS